MKDIITLSMESSCDETAVAILKNGREVLANIVSTQIELHKKFGGVVPEVASRKHIENIDAVFQEAIDTAGIKLEDIDHIAVTYETRASRSFISRTFLCKSTGVFFKYTSCWC